MALINIAVHLAQIGRRVLAVDFDLEAPGLDTFDLPRPSRPTPGIVDFVGEYLATGEAPSIEKFVFESSGIGNDGGRLWMMPSGAHLDSYASTFANIDWGNLYGRHQGYLLFEDLKEQWRQTLDLDYVLVDSRTGHTDVSGICTRQLPDAVAILFFPNDQNLRGLTKVVQDIRAEASKPRKKNVRLHFVMSNVPRLDDEDGILEKRISAFGRALKFEDLLEIHREDSFSLLDQIVFTRDRPKSRLAKQYGAIAMEIMRHNPEDREGVIDLLEQLDPIPYLTPSRRNWARRLFEADKELETIAKTFQEDGDVLFRLASLRYRLGRANATADLLDQAIEAGFDNPEVFLKRAQVRSNDLQDPEGAHQDAMRVITSGSATADQVLQALNILGADNIHVDDLSELSSMLPEERVHLAGQLNSTISEARVATMILGPLLAESGLPDRVVSLGSLFLVLSLIAVGKYRDAIDVIRSNETRFQELRIQNTFNYGMALWGETGKIDRDLFKRVVDYNRENPQDDLGLNLLQCLAVANWAVGQLEEAEELVMTAIQELQSRRGAEFSCWCYLRIPRKEFEEDLADILRLIKGDVSVRPRFMSSAE